jgi:hypothetical protein
MRALFVSFVIYLAATVSVAQQPAQSQQWQRYTVKGEEFSVSLPALPAMTTQKFSNRNPQLDRIVRVLGSYGSGIAYAIHTYENPQGQSLEEFIDYIKPRRSRLREWKESTDISVNGFPGKQIVLSERDVPGTVQFFRTKKHLYQFESFGALTGDPRVQEFFSSIVFGKKPESINVEDGIGAQPIDLPSQSAPVIVGSGPNQAGTFLHGISSPTRHQRNCRFESSIRVDRRSHRRSGRIRTPAWSNRKGARCHKANQVRSSDEERAIRFCLSPA